MKYRSDRNSVAGLSARPPGPRRIHRRGLSRLRDRPQLRLRADKLPSPNKSLLRVVISLVGFQKSLSERKQNNTQGRHHYSLYAAPRTPSSPGRFAGLARGGDSLSCVKFFATQWQCAPVPCLCRVTCVKISLLLPRKKDRKQTTQGGMRGRHAATTQLTGHTGILRREVWC